MVPTFRARSALVLFALAAFSACGGANRPVEAPVELAIAPIGADAGITTKAEAPGANTCSVRLTLSGRIEKTSFTCYLEEQISKTAGVLRYPCSGNGLVEAEFGEHRYTGRANNGEVELERSSELDWDDGCHWGTQAIISGLLVSRGETAKNLSWRYRDHVITGSACSSVCTAKATLQVMSLNRKDVPSLRDADDDAD